MICCSKSRNNDRLISRASYPPFTRAPRPGFEPGFESGFDSNRPGYVHTGSGILVVNDVTTGVKYINK